MKECTLEANLEGQVAIKIVHHFVDSNLGVEIYAWKRRNCLADQR